MTAFRAGVAYFAIVFAAGFIFGTIRVLAVAPLTGATIAVLIELPFMLTFAWFVCRRLGRRFALPPSIRSGFVMGVTAFILLMIAEYMLARALGGVSLQTYLAEFLTLPGAIGLAGQVGFAVMPLLQAR